MKMLAPELSPATIFLSQRETKIAKCDIGEAQCDPCRTTRKDKHRKYRPINEQFASRLRKKSFTLGSYNLTKTYC